MESQGSQHHAPPLPASLVKHLSFFAALFLRGLACRIACRQPIHRVCCGVQKNEIAHCIVPLNYDSPSGGCRIIEVEMGAAILNQV